MTGDCTMVCCGSCQSDGTSSASGTATVEVGGLGEGTSSGVGTLSGTARVDAFSDMLFSLGIVTEVSEDLPVETERDFALGVVTEKTFALGID